MNYVKKLVGLFAMVAVVWTAPAAHLPSPEPVATPLQISGVRTSARSLTSPYTDPTRPPLEGPLIGVAVHVTDARLEDDFDGTAIPQFGVDGNPLPGAVTDYYVAILDSGASTFLMSYPDSVNAGVQADFLTSNALPVGGIGGQAEVGVSQPFAMFVHGLQEIQETGMIDPSIMVGESNISTGVNTQSNHENGNEVPSVIGVPMLGYFPVLIQNSQPVQHSFLGEYRSTPSVTFYTGPDDPTLPELSYRIFMELRPPTAVLPQYFPFLDANLEYFEPLFPTFIFMGSGSLFYTASEASFREGELNSSGKLMVDTGAQATLISQVAAAELGLDLKNPEFEVDIQGVAGTVVAPGFYMDRVTLPALGGILTWENAPVIVLNVMGPEGTTMYGILGTNMLANRDILFNGAAETPYLDISGPISSQTLRITDMRLLPPDTLEIDWLAEPAPSEIVLQQCENPFAEIPEWTNIATGELATVTGTFTLSIDDPVRQYYRIVPGGNP